MTKPRARPHTTRNGVIWSVWSDIATGYGLSIDAAYEGWRRAESLHQMQCVAPRKRWTCHIARWMDC